MAIYKEDIVDIELESGTIHRSWLMRAIGLGDAKGNRFGVRLLRNGEPVNVGSATVTGLFMAPNGTNYVINESQVSGSTWIDGNVAGVILPSGCYAVEGQFCLAIKLSQSGVVTTMRIIDGMVSNTGTTGAVVPSSNIPTGDQIIAAYQQAMAVIDNSVRYDVSQELTNAQKRQARLNVNAAGMALLAPVYSSSSTYAVGDHVHYDGYYYVCNTAITTAEEWTAAHWTQVTVGGEVNDLKSAINDLDLIVNGERNYIVGEKLITAAGATKGQLTPDSNFSTSELIDISLFGGNGKTIKVDYGEISENTMFALYNSNGEFLDSWSLASNTTNRQFTFSYTSYTNPKYVRFSFEDDYNARIVIMSGATESILVWKKASSGGNTNNIAQLQGEVDAFPESYMQKDTYIDTSMVNRLDPSACQLNKIITPSTGSVDTYDGYFTTDYIPITQGETLRFWRIDTVSVKTVRMFAAFDSNKNVIADLGSTSEVSSITQSGDMAFVRCSLAYYPSDFARTPEDSGALTNVNPVYIPGFGNNSTIKSKYLSRDIVWVRKTDTEAQIIQKFVNAFNNGNTDIYFERASYSFGTELAKVSTDYGMLHNEIPIGNGCRYYFNGSVLTAVIDLSEHPAVGDDEFYCNFFGCQRRPSSYELHDGVLNATDTRYVVHDESSALEGSYYHLYQNMELIYHTSARQETIRKCIGGGTGASGVVEIVGCKFTTDGTDSCVSFHGNGTDVVGAEFDLNVRDSWFSNNIRGGTLSAHQTARMFYTGNSAAGEPTVYDRWTVTKFLNEVRN